MWPRSDKVFGAVQPLPAAFFEKVNRDFEHDGFHSVTLTPGIVSARATAVRRGAAPARPACIETTPFALQPDERAGWDGGACLRTAVAHALSLSCGTAASRAASKAGPFSVRPETAAEALTRAAA